ncbi:MAG: GNAT family N-acetyltransferase [Pseudomonadota bacterium]
MDAAAGAAIRFKIRRARAQEAQALTELSLRAKAVWGYEASFLARCRRAMQLSPETVRHRPHYVAQDAAGRLLGFYGLEPEPEGIGLDTLFVEPGAIGQGIGRALWHHALKTARRLGYDTLMVVSDPNAAGFYLKMGCRPAGAWPSEIEPGRNLPLFRFALSPGVS